MLLVGELNLPIIRKNILNRTQEKVSIKINIKTKLKKKVIITTYLSCLTEKNAKILIFAYEI